MRHSTTRLAWLVAILGGVVLAAGCGAAGSSTASLSPPSPSANRVPVLGTTTDCGLEDLRTTGTSAGVESQTATLHCTYEMSDPRVSATEQAKLTMHWVTVPGAEVDYFSLEDDVLTNDGGTWRGSGWGSEYYDESGALHTSGTAVFLGEGGYDGLSYRMLLARETGPRQPYWVSGWIEPTS